jgi:hypothetical protein
MPRHNRKGELRRRRARRWKLVDLRRRYAAAKTEEERVSLLAKLARVAPTISPQQFLTAVKAPAKSAGTAALT